MDTREEIVKVAMEMIRDSETPLADVEKIIKIYDDMIKSIRIYDMSTVSMMINRVNFWKSVYLEIKKVGQLTQPQSEG